MTHGETLVITKTQVPDQYRRPLDDQIATYNQGRSIQQVARIPDTKDMPLDDRRHWLKIPGVICVYVDMVGSTLLSATNHEKSTAGAFQLFTDTAVRLFDTFDAAYIDVRGDGVFALFDVDQPYRAVASAITFKTFAKEEFVPRVEKDTGLTLGAHIGIDQKTVLVKKLGIRQRGGRGDRQNEVWAGKPVNMAAKLASRTSAGQLLASDRFFNRITHERVRMSCGCPNGVPKPLWTERDVSADRIFDFDKAYLLDSNWCSTHGAAFCDSVMRLDKC